MKIHGGVKEKDFLDFSISVNPLKPSWINELSFEENYRYTYVEWLEDAFREKFGQDTVITAGSSEALQIIAYEIMKDSTVIVPVPNYYEYSRVAKFCAQEIVSIKIFNSGIVLEVFEEIIRTATQLREKNKKVVFITSNPNNPVGKFLDLSSYLNNLVELGVVCILDESFIDFVDVEKVNEFEKKLKYPEKVIRLRTFTKIFGVPGIRVGYVKSGEYKSLFQTRRIPWAIGGVGYSFVENLRKHNTEHFLRETREFIASEKQKFKDFPTVLSDTNYFLLKVKNVDYILEKLRERKITVRDARNFEIGEYVRIGLRDSQSNDVLVNSLKEIGGF